MIFTQADMLLDAHLSPEEILALRDGELESPAARRHLEQCSICRARLVKARRLAALLRAALLKERRKNLH